MTARATLKTGREKSALNRHPWLYAGAIRQIDGDPNDGDVVEVCDAGGRFIAWGYLNRRSSIAIRLLSWRRADEIDAHFWRCLLAQSIARRADLATGAEGTNAYRLVHAEADGVPGLVLDRYGDWAVAQFLTLGVEVWKRQLTTILAELLPKIRGFYERSDVDVRAKEGLSPTTGVLFGDPPPPEVIVLENGLRFAVDLKSGHKTGFYLDQRENRTRMEKYASGNDLLNCFSYTGAFAVYAARGGAQHITNVETSAAAMALARRNMELNSYDHQGSEYVEDDVFHQLRRYRDAGRRFDLIVMDPPKFAHSQRAVKKAARGYKDINWLAMRLLRPGGHLFTFSCSGAVSVELFQKILFSAALDAGREVQIIGRLSQGPDHPVLVTFPESAYLKGFVCRVG